MTDNYFLTEDQIEANKHEFLTLLSTIDIEGADLQGLGDYIVNSDFFTAPASTQYHSCFKGGLCFHSLNVYHWLVKLYNEAKDKLPREYSEDTLKLVALFHDISKVNFYEVSIKNKKVYNEQGSKHDAMGNFEWISEEGYATKDSHDRFIAGTHGYNSVMLLSQYVPLTLEENVAIYNHHMGMDDKNATYDLSAICNTYPLLTLLHTADLLATYIDERM